MKKDLNFIFIDAVYLLVSKNVHLKNDNEIKFP